MMSSLLLDVSDRLSYRRFNRDLHRTAWTPSAAVTTEHALEVASYSYHLLHTTLHTRICLSVVIGKHLGSKIFGEYTRLLDQLRIKLLFYSVSKKNPPYGFLKFFPNGWEFLINFLHTYYVIISTLDYNFLFKYLQLWQSYAILSATT